MHPIGMKRVFMLGSCPLAHWWYGKKLQYGRRAMITPPMNVIRTVKDLLGKMAFVDCSYHGDR